MSTEVPSEQYPCKSGGETEISATSSGIAPERNRDGASLKKTGM